MFTSNLSNNIYALFGKLKQFFSCIYHSLFDVSEIRLISIVLAVFLHVVEQTKNITGSEIRPYWPT